MTTLTPAEFSAKLDRFAANEGKFDLIINGDTSVTVATDGGVVPSVARALGIDLDIQGYAAAAAAAVTAATIAAAYRSALAFATWSEVSAVTGTAGQGAVVWSDTGTHTDPVVGGTVANSGVYSYSTSPAGWRRIAPLQDLSLATPGQFAGSIASTITAKNVAHLTSAAAYTETGITLGNHQAILGHNARWASVASTVFVLSGYSPQVDNIYFSGNTSSTDPLISIDGSYAAQVTSIRAVNAGVGGLHCHNTNADPSGNRSGTARDIKFEGVTGYGFHIDTAVNKWNWVNCEAFGQIDYDVGGLGRPRAGSVGWLIDPADRTIAVGGHQFSNCRAESLDKGWVLNGTQLLMPCNFFADSIRDYGMDINDSDQLDLLGLFLGTTRGLRVRGNSVVTINALTTILTGVIPPDWGASDFFHSVSTFYDVTVEDTAKLAIKSWRGGKKVSVASGATLDVEEGAKIRLDTETAVAPSTTVFLKPGGGFSSTESDALFRPDEDSWLFMLDAYGDVTPSSGAHTLTTRMADGSGTISDTALVCSIASGQYGAAAYDGGIFIPKGRIASVKLATGPGSSVSIDGRLQMLPANG